MKSNAVSQQDTDTFVNQAAATAAAVRSAQANVQRLSELQSFEKVYAPFDGVVTARTIDTGQLIDQGAGKELFHLQAIQTLRVYTNVPQNYSQTVKRGMKIDLTFAEHAGKVYQGTLVRTADAIDPASRTLLVEIDVDNRAGELLPGSLAQVHFKTPPAGPVFIVPVGGAHLPQGRNAVGTVVQRQTSAHLVPVVIGEDDGATVQIVSGLNAADRVIQDPPDSLIEGEKVTVVNPGKPPMREASSNAGAWARISHLGLPAALRRVAALARGLAVCLACLPAASPLVPTTIGPATRRPRSTRRPARPRLSCRRPILPEAVGSRPRLLTACCAASGGRSTRIRN